MAENPPAGRSRVNEDAIRLWLLDQSLQHLTRQAGVLGLGANITHQSLRAERDQIVARLAALGEAAAKKDAE